MRRFGRGPLGVEELAGLAITMSDFQAAIPKVQPSVRREGFTTTPDVTWEDVGSLDEVREGGRDSRFTGGMAGSRCGTAKVVRCKTRCVRLAGVTLVKGVERCKARFVRLAG